MFLYFQSLPWMLLHQQDNRAHTKKRNMKQLQVFQVNLQPTEEQTKYQVDAVFLIWEITRCWIQRDRLLFKVSDTLKWQPMQLPKSVGVNSILQLFTSPQKTNNPSHPSLQDFFKVHFFETCTALYLLLRAVPREKKTFQHLHVTSWTCHVSLSKKGCPAALRDENTHNGQMSPTNLRNRLKLKNWNMSNFDTATLTLIKWCTFLVAFGLNVQLGCVQTKCRKDLCPYALIFKARDIQLGDEIYATCKKLMLQWHYITKEWHSGINMQYFLL